MRAHRHAHGAELLVHLIDGVGQAVLVERRAELGRTSRQGVVDVFATRSAGDRRIGAEGLEVGIVFEAEEINELRNGADAANSNLHIAVFALLRTSACAHEVFVADRSGLNAMVDAVGKRCALNANERFELRAVDRLAFARFFGMDNGGERRPCAHEAGHVVARERLGNRRRRAREAIEARVARESLANGVEAGLLHVIGVARLAEARNVENDERGIVLPQNVIGETPLRPRAALGRLDEHIGVFNEPEQHFLAFVARNVQRHHALVATLGRPCVAIHAIHIGSLHALQLNNVSALFGEKAAYKRARDNGRRIDDLQAVKVAELRQIS